MSAPSFARAAETASLKGMALGVLAYSMFAFHDALVKGVIMVMPIAQIMFVRSLVIVLGCLLIGRGKLIADLAGSTNIPMILMRTISKSESSLTQIFFLNLVHLSVMGLVSIWLWQPMGWREVGFIVATGVIGGIAQYVLVEAARAVPASVLGTVEYSALFWSFLLGYLFWNEQPGMLVYIGAGLVVAAGLVLAWSERRSRRAINTVMPVAGGDLT